MAKTVELDEELKKVDGVEYPPLPLSCEVPVGWPKIKMSEYGECWYQEAINFEKLTGNKVVPLEMNPTGFIEIEKGDE